MSIELFDTGGLEIFSDTWSKQQIFNAGLLVIDDQSADFGTGSTVKLIYETADADANCIMLVMPEGGATDVPVFILGDASIDGQDLTWFNGLTEPSLAIVNDAKDAYVRIDAGDDAVAGSKGIYFKAAADELVVIRYTC